MTRPNPLRQQLDRSQALLLQVIAQSALSASDALQRRWPAWAWVQHELAEQGVTNASDVLLSLPTVPRAAGIPGDLVRPYGLVWRADNHTPEPTPEERVGLSIAGLPHVAFHGLGGHVPNLADRLVGLLANLAELERKEATPTPAGPRSIARLLGDADPNLVDSAFGLSDEVVAAVVQREYYFIPVSDGPRGSTVILGRGRFRQYRGLTGVNDYLDAVWAEAQRALPDGTDARQLVMSTQPAQATDPQTSGPSTTLGAALQLHLAVVQDAARSWDTAAYATAVFDAFRGLEHRVQELARQHGREHRKHVVDYFTGKPAWLDGGTSSDSTRQTERDGVSHLVRGSMMALRDPRAHGAPRADTAEEAAEYLAVASLLHRRVDLAEQRLILAVDDEGNRQT